MPPEVLSWLPAHKVTAPITAPVDARPFVTVRVRLAGVTGEMEYPGVAHGWQVAPAVPAFCVLFHIGTLGYYGWLPANRVTRR